MKARLRSAVHTASTMQMLASLVRAIVSWKPSKPNSGVCNPSCSLLHRANKKREDTNIAKSKTVEIGPWCSANGAASLFTAVYLNSE